MSSTVFINGSIWTGVQDGVTVDALAIEGQKIIALGQAAKALATSAGTVIDLKGGMLLPAFGDGHAHPLYGGLESIGPEIKGAPTLEILLERVRVFAIENPDKEWIVGASYESWHAPNGEFDAAWLDAVVPDRPVVLRANDYHTIWCNSRALEIAGVTKDTPQPPLGKIVHRADGTPMGTMREWGAVNLIMDHLPENSRNEFREGFRVATETLAASGITWVQDAWIDPGMPESYLDALKNNLLGVRYNLALRADPFNWRNQLEWFASARESIGIHSHLTCKTIKFFADGVIEGGTAALKSDYSDAPDSKGMPCWDWQELKEAVAAVDAMGFQPHIHAIGDAAIHEALNAIEYARSVNKENSHSRPVITHVQLLDPVDLPRFARLGVIANFEPLWACDDPLQSELTTPRLGSERAAWQYPIKSLLDDGAAVSFGSDWPVTTQRPLDCLTIAITREHASAKTPSPWIPDQRITVEQALSAYTAGPAYQAGDEKVRGTLQLGFEADLVWLDRDICAIDPNLIPSARVLGTWCLGTRVFTNTDTEN
ncbi:MAG: amidohydrolase [Actinomycetes bacterium]